MDLWKSYGTVHTILVESMETEYRHWKKKLTNKCNRKSGLTFFLLIKIVIGQSPVTIYCRVECYFTLKYKPVI
jgi:hypothetical protein